ncbi:HTH-type transcriptional regulator YesS [compost metagenome]
MKPVIKQQLEDVLVRTMALVTEQNEQSIRKSKLQHLEKKNRNEELQEALVRLTDGSLPAQSEAYHMLVEELNGPQYSVAVLEADLLPEATDRWSDKEGRLIDFAISNILQEMVVAPGKGHICMREGKHVLVVSHNGEAEALELANQIKETIKGYLKLDASIGMSRPVMAFSQIAGAYERAGQALDNKYFIGLNEVILYAPNETKTVYDKELYAMQKDVVAGLMNNSSRDVETSLLKLLAAIKSMSYGDRTLAVTTCLSSVMSMLNELSTSGVRLPVESLGMRDLQHRLGAYETFEWMQNDIVRLFDYVFRSMEVDSGNKDKLLMAKVTKYIEEHYAEDITLESVSGLAFMNPYYFSSFFKKHMKQNFKQYVTEVRMKQAVRLLIHTDQMVYEIAENVGYNNARHFSDMFKKQYGQLPNDYRNDHKKRE